MTIAKTGLCFRTTNCLSLLTCALVAPSRRSTHPSSNKAFDKGRLRQKFSSFFAVDSGFSNWGFQIKFKIGNCYLNHDFLCRTLCWFEPLMLVLNVLLTTTIVPCFCALHRLSRHLKMCNLSNLSRNAKSLFSEPETELINTFKTLENVSGGLTEVKVIACSFRTLRAAFWTAGSDCYSILLAGSWMLFKEVLLEQVNCYLYSDQESQIT